MKIIKSFFDNTVFLLEPKHHKDKRGIFFETYNKLIFKELGIINNFTQDNNSISNKKNTFRGIHLQVNPYEQAKLIRVVKGEIIDYIIDLRKNSKSFGKYIAINLSPKLNHIIYIPKGFGHGFLTIKNNTIVNYKVDKKYSKFHSKSIIFSDSSININFKGFNTKKFILSNNDKAGMSLKDFKKFYIK